MVMSIVEKIFEFGLDIGISSIKKAAENAIVKEKYISKLSEYISRQKKYNGLYSIDEEYDFEGLLEYIKGNFYNEALMAITGTERERKSARKEIYEAAYKCSQTKTAKSKRIIHKQISNCIEILRKIERDKIPDFVKIIATEIEDTVISHLDESSDEIKDTIKNAKEEICKKVDDAFSVGKMYELTKAGDYIEFENRIRCQLQSYGAMHPLNNQYRFGWRDNRLVSVPISKEATIKYPPRIECQATAKIGDMPVPYITEAEISYANRHQLPIIISIEEAKKFLGDIEDPVQYEAEELIGKQLIKEPKSFAPPMPYEILIDDVVVFKYIELGLVEILDDDSYVLTNEKQKDKPILFTIIFNTQTHKVDFSIKQIEQTNKNLLNVSKLMQAASEGRKIAIHSLISDDDFIAGNFSNCTYQTGFSDFEEEVDFLQRLYELSQYVGKEIIPTAEISASDFNNIIYISELIRGNTVEISDVHQLNCTGIVSDDFRRKIHELKNEKSDYAFLSSAYTDIFGVRTEFTILRQIKNTFISNFEKLKQLADLLENGQEVTIILETDSGCCIDQIAPEKMRKNLSEKA